MSELTRTRRAIKTTVGPDAMVTFLMILYFSSNLLGSIVSRLMGPGVTIYVFNFFFWVTVVFICAAGRYRQLGPSLVLYPLIAVLLAVAVLFYQENNSWLLEGSYRVQIQFLSARAGIWAFLVLSLHSDRKKIADNVNIVAWIALLYYGAQFIISTRRGYWTNSSIAGNGETVSGRYNLEFGYNMLFPVVYFGIKAFMTGKNKYYNPCAVGALMILLGGSRGALVCIPAAFFLAIPFKWNGMSPRKKKQAIVLIALLIPLLILFYLYFSTIISFLFTLLSRVGLSSRSIDAVIEGYFSSENGRDRIRSIVVELIKTGGPFGRGVYGERVAVGEYVKWGYSHNILLEMLCAFGYVGGTILILLLGFFIVKTYKRCTTVPDKIVFVTFLGASLKLMLSDSFWYCETFWALLAIMVFWKKHPSAEPAFSNRPVK